MKLYSYSSAVLMFVEVKWLKLKYAAIVIAAGLIIFLVIVVMTQSLDLLQFRATNAIKLENAFLQQQIFLMVPRVNGLERQLITLNEHSNTLYGELNNGPLVRDSVFHFTNAAIGSFLNTLNTVQTKKYNNNSSDLIKNSIVVLKK